MRTLLRATAWAVQAWLTADTAYLLGLLAVAATRRDAPIAAAPGSPLEVVTLVPAHDEGAGLRPTVASLLAQDHPGDLHHVVVIADNCSDDTADQARAAGATVWERQDAAHRGKGHALAWALERVWRTWPSTGAVAVVDADCVASPGLIAAFDRRVRAGAGAVQADYRVSNPGASPAAARRWAGFALMHAVRGRAKAALGLSCGLFGTGMAFRVDVLQEVPWTSFSITEDAEYHIRLVEAGHPARFAAEAYVDSPMPETERDASDQQTRWEAGNVALARGTVAPLVRRGLRRRDPVALHAGLEQLVLPQSVLAAGAATVAAAAVVLRDRRLATLALAGGTAQVLYVLGGLALVRAPVPVWRALAAAPELVARKLVQLARIGMGGGPTEFVRTKR